MKNYLVQCLFLFSLFNLSVGVAFAFEEEHEAHEHGHATLMLVQEKDELQLVFKSPAMNIVGFEHQPSSPEQHEKVDRAEKSLSKANSLFVINQQAQCVLEHAHVKSSLLEKSEHGDEHTNHAEAEHDSHSDDKHSDDKHSDDKHSDDKHSDDKHSDDNHSVDKHSDDKSSHSEFEAEYHFECKNISALKTIKLTLFDAFSSIEEIEAQIITSSGQQLLELDHNNVSIKF
ncbi:MAG: hypothetical protein ACJAS1_002975 [Oleiphilaceae bacterium]|jgi:hypothetical protein